MSQREREKDEESMRMGKERKSPGKTDVPKLYTYKECELSVQPPDFNMGNPPSPLKIVFQWKMVS